MSPLSFGRGHLHSCALSPRHLRQWPATGRAWPRVDSSRSGDVTSPASGAHPAIARGQGAPPRSPHPGWTPAPGGTTPVTKDITLPAAWDGNTGPDPDHTHAPSLHFGSAPHPATQWVTQGLQNS